MKRVYADCAATTKISKSALNALIEGEENYGNPSSLHTLGQYAKEALEQARQDIANCINAKAEEIYFTSGGSESDNQALLSCAYEGAKKGKKHLISTAFEHHAILHTLKKLEKEGFSVTLLQPNKDGFITAEQVEQAIQADTALVSVMYANNEVGSIQPIAEIGKVCEKHKIPFHTDAVQAAGHLPIDVQQQKIDLLSISAHKFHGPRGIGVLYARKGIRLSPLICGGAQEKGKRAGTENLPAILGMAQALKDACMHMSENTSKVTILRNELIEGLQKIPHSKLNGAIDNRLAGNVNFSFEGVEGESLLLYLDMEGICVSSGSACASSSLEPSHVLLAIGVPKEVAHGSIRISLDQENSQEDVKYILEKLPPIIDKLRAMSPVWDELQKGQLKHWI